MSTIGSQPQLVQTLEVTEVDGERQNKVKTREYETATDEKPEEYQEPKSIHQTKFPRVARRVARVPEARGGLKGEGGRGEVGRNERKRGRWLEERREQKSCLLWS